MRIADRLRYEIFKSNLGSIKTKIDANQTMIASGKRILKPSDDPAVIGRSMQIQAEKSAGEQYKRNLDKLKMTGTFYETSVDTIQDLLTRAKELAVSMSSGNMDATARKAAAEEVDGIIQQLVTVGNTKVAGTYIFGGKKGISAPYSASGTFSGTDEVNQIAVDGGSTMDAGISGSRIFEGDGVNIFTALQAFQQHLSDNDVSGVRGDLDTIDDAIDLTTNNLSYVGTYSQRIDTMIDANTTKDLNLTTTQSELIDGDMTQLIADYNTLSTAYQSVLYTMSKLQDLSILNYMT
jgi:flagellar hook-associated protein 3 FlgL